MGRIIRIAQTKNSSGVFVKTIELKLFAAIAKNASRVMKIIFRICKIFHIVERYHTFSMDPPGVEPGPVPCHGTVLPLYYGPVEEIYSTKIRSRRGL
jgi:hypothetical protein